MIYNDTYVAPWVDLRPLDIDAQDIINRAVELARILIPEWIQEEGLLEFNWIKVLAQMLDEAIFTSNRRAVEDFRGLLRLCGLTISDGAAPTATVTVTAFDTTGYTIPLGTKFRFKSSDAIPVEIILQSTAVGTIPTGATTVTVPVVGLTATSAGNGAPIGTALEILDSLSFLDYARLGSTITDGAPRELEPDFLDRGAVHLDRLTDSLVLARHYTNAVLEDIRVGRAATFDLTEGIVVGGDSPGTVLIPDRPGHVTVAVAAFGGVPLSGSVKAQLLATLQARSRADLIVHVVDASIVSAGITVTVRRYREYAAGDVTTAVTNALNTFFDPQRWEWGRTIVLNDVIAAVDNAPGVDVVTTCTIFGGTPDLTILPSQIVKPGPYTVVVTDP